MLVQSALTKVNRLTLIQAVHAEVLFIDSSCKILMKSVAHLMIIMLS